MAKKQLDNRRQNPSYRPITSYIHRKYGKIAQVEFLKFNSDGLIPVIVQDADTKSVLMMAWMNETAIQRTLETRRATYWSRSRQCYWVKGETSGHIQQVVSLHYDCDADALLLSVQQTGPACHTNAPSCFFNELELP